MRTLYTDVVCAVDHFDLVCACFYLTRNRIDILPESHLMPCLCPDSVRFQMEGDGHGVFACLRLFCKRQWIGLFRERLHSRR